jgi:hypothetical protein
MYHLGCGMRRIAVTVLAVAALAPATAGHAQGVPPQAIPQDPTASGFPDFTGFPAAPNPVQAPDPPRHPHMAPNGRSNLHDDAYQTDTYQGFGPLGNELRVRSTFFSADCASVTFDSKDRIVTICVGVDGPRLAMIDPKTMSTLALFQLPPRIPGGSTIFNDFAGGGYFYLDDKDRAVLPTTTRHIWVVRETSAPGFQLERDFDVTSAVPPGDKVISALPDWSGRIWFASIEGVVGTVDPASGALKSVALGETNQNSFAVDDDGGVYIVTEKALYRFDAGADGTPQETWREVYPNSGIPKPGQASAGSGTTPTLMGRELVSITDNADPMNVLVYRRGRSVSGPREICRQPVFQMGASATDNSLIATETAMVVENNYGYTGPTATMDGKVTSPGVERVDLDADGSGCHTVWRSDEISPTVVPKLSLAAGLVYLYTKTTDDDDPWYLTAVDFRTGQTRWKKLTGAGLGYNNNYAPITLGPDGTAYVGALGGLVQVRDKIPPAEAGGSKPTFGLRVRRLRRHRLRASVTGRDAGALRRVDFYVGRRRMARDGSEPFIRTIRVRRFRARRVYRLTARYLLRDGRRLSERRKFKGSRRVRR